MIEALVILTLTYPYKRAVQFIQDLVSIWNLRMISSSTRSETAIISISWKKFKNIFGSNPQVGEIDVPVKMQKYVNKVEIKRVFTSEKND